MNEYILTQTTYTNIVNNKTWKYHDIVYYWTWLKNYYGDFGGGEFKN